MAEREQPLQEPGSLSHAYVGGSFVAMCGYVRGAREPMNASKPRCRECIKLEAAMPEQVQTCWRSLVPERPQNALCSSCAVLAPVDPMADAPEGWGEIYGTADHTRHLLCPGCLARWIAWENGGDRDA